jgi:hypothetical protein
MEAKKVKKIKKMLDKWDILGYSIQYGKPARGLP